MADSLIAGIGSALLAVAISLPGAYIFARKFPLRDTLFYMIVGTLIFLFILLIVPITITWIRLGLFDTFMGCGWRFRSSRCRTRWDPARLLVQLPRYLEEAAMVYGCTQFQAFYKVMLPLAKPVIVSVLFLAFLKGGATSCSPTCRPPATVRAPPRSRSTWRPRAASASSGSC